MALSLSVPSILFPMMIMLFSSAIFGQKINTLTIQDPVDIAGDDQIGQAEWGDNFDHIYTG